MPYLRYTMDTGRAFPFGGGPRAADFFLPKEKAPFQELSLTGDLLILLMLHRPYKCLTSRFGMELGVTTWLSSPDREIVLSKPNNTQHISCFLFLRTRLF